MDPNFDDPQKLIRQAKDGDKEAFGKLYKIYFVPVFRYVYWRVHDGQETEDIVQEVFLKIYNSLESYEDQGKNPLAYFFTVARNKVIDFYRKGKNVSLNENLALLDEAESQEGDPEKTFEREERAKIVKAAIRSLNDTQQEVIILKYFSGLSNARIAQMLGKREDAIRQTQHRALKILKQKLEEIL